MNDGLNKMACTGTSAKSGQQAGSAFAANRNMKGRSVPSCSLAQKPSGSERVRYGGSVWVSNLLGADSPSTYEEGLGLNWKDLPSFGILNAAFLPPRFFIPLFSSEEPFQRLDCWPPASHRAPLACKRSLLCECPNAAEVLAEPSSPLVTNEAAWSTNGENCASR
jgi:hypothetical protein